MARRTRKAVRRKQRVTLRQRRRAEISGRLREVVAKTVVAGVGFALVSAVLLQGDSFFRKFLVSHTPKIQVKAPVILQGLPVKADLPQQLLWLWIPGAGAGARGRIIKKYPPVKNVIFDKDFSQNVITVRLEPRTPLIQWGEQGLDGSGAVFAIQAGAWTRLPKALFPPTQPQPTIGKWLTALSQRQELWAQVASVGIDSMGNMQLALQTGTQVTWGPPQTETVAPKSAALWKVLEDAHQHLGGAASADLRFFDVGRIIVKSKTPVK